MYKTYFNSNLTEALTTIYLITIIIISKCLLWLIDLLIEWLLFNTKLTEFQMYPYQEQI
jgi:hypothetical protein